MQNLLQTIQENQTSYSPAQKAIADYIIAHYIDIPFQTITQIGQATGTSETTISKFCSELGLSGFSGLKRLASDYVNASLPLNNRFENTVTRLDDDTAVDEVLRCDLDNIRATLLNLNNRANLQKLPDMIDNACCIYTIGGRSSSCFASFLAFKMRQLGVAVHNIDFGLGDYVDKMMMIGPSDLVFAFSFPRYTKRIVEVLRQLRERGVPIVLVTGEGLSPAFDCAELVFTCRTTSRSYVASYVSCIALINAVLITYALQHKEQMERNLRLLEKNLIDFDMFL